MLCTLVNDSCDYISNDKSTLDISNSNNKGLLKLKSEYYNLITELCFNKLDGRLSVLSDKYLNDVSLGNINPENSNSKNYNFWNMK